MTINQIIADANNAIEDATQVTAEDVYGYFLPTGDFYCENTGVTYRIMYTVFSNYDLSASNYDEYSDAAINLSFVINEHADAYIEVSVQDEDGEFIYVSRVCEMPIVCR